MTLNKAVLLVGQTCGSMLHVEQESLEHGTCCTCTEGAGTAGVVTQSTMLRQCLLHAAQMTLSTCISLPSGKALALTTTPFNGAD